MKIYVFLATKMVTDIYALDITESWLTNNTELSSFRNDANLHIIPCSYLWLAIDLC